MNLLAVEFDNSGAEIEGSAEALRALADQLGQCSDRCEMSTEASAQPSFRTHIARSIVILLENGQANVSASPEALVISGSKENLNLVSQNILYLLDDTSEHVSNHIHLEYFADESSLFGKSSLPLIISLNRQ